MSEDAITPEQAKAELEKLNEPSKDYSLASQSKITTPEQDEKKSKAKEALQKLINDVTNQREEIDKINHNINYLAEQLTATNAAVNKQTELIQQIITQGQVKVTSDNPQMGNIMALKEILDSKLGDKLLDRVFPSNNMAAPALISQETINQKMTQAFMDDLDTGESIRKFISDTLKKRATKEIVNKSLGSIGQVEHEPA